MTVLVVTSTVLVVTSRVWAISAWEKPRLEEADRRVGRPRGVSVNGSQQLLGGLGSRVWPGRRVWERGDGFWSGAGWEGPPPGKGP